MSSPSKSSVSPVSDYELVSFLRTLTAGLSDAHGTAIVRAVNGALERDSLALSSDVTLGGILAAWGARCAPRAEELVSKANHALQLATQRGEFLAAKLVEQEHIMAEARQRAERLEAKVVEAEGLEAINRRLEADLARAVARAEMDAESAKLAADDLRSRIRSMEEREAMETKRKEADAERQAFLEEEVQRLERELAGRTGLEKKFRTLRRRAATLTDEMSQVDQLRAEIRKLKAENEKLEGKRGEYLRMFKDSRASQRKLHEHMEEMRVQALSPQMGASTNDLSQLDPFLSPKRATAGLQRMRTMSDLHISRRDSEESLPGPLSPRRHAFVERADAMCGPDEPWPFFAEASTGTDIPIPYFAESAVGGDIEIPRFTETQSGSTRPIPTFHATISGSEAPIPAFHATISGSDVPIPSFDTAQSGTDNPIPTFSTTDSGGERPIPSFEASMSGTDLEIPTYASASSGEGKEIPSFASAVAGEDRSIPRFEESLCGTDVPIPTHVESSSGGSLPIPVFAATSSDTTDLVPAGVDASSGTVQSMQLARMSIASAPVAAADVSPIVPAECKHASTGRGIEDGGSLFSADASVGTPPPREDPRLAMFRSRMADLEAQIAGSSQNDTMARIIEQMRVLREELKSSESEVSRLREELERERSRVTDAALADRAAQLEAKLAEALAAQRAAQANAQRCTSMALEQSLTAKKLEAESKRLSSRVTRAEAIAEERGIVCERALREQSGLLRNSMRLMADRDEDRMQREQLAEDIRRLPSVASIMHERDCEWSRGLELSSTTEEQEWRIRGLETDKATLQRKARLLELQAARRARWDEL